jgi:hypothetical protein
MLKRYGGKALEESAARTDEFALAGDDDRAGARRRCDDLTTGCGF